MFATTYEVTVTLANCTAVPFTDADPTVGAAGAALAQVKACRDIDSFAVNEGEKIGVIIPYHAIDYVTVEATRASEEDPVDDNCKE